MLNFFDQIYSTPGVSGIPLAQYGAYWSDVWARAYGICMTSLYIETHPKVEGRPFITDNPTFYKL